MLGVVLDVFPCEDGDIQSGDLWIADRNFMRAEFLSFAVGETGLFRDPPAPIKFIG